MKKNTLLLFAFALLLTSCMQEALSPEAFSKRIQITGELALVDTRTTLNEDGLTPLWQATDKLGVFSEATSNAEFSLSSGSGTSSGTFSGAISGTPLYAYYPYNSEGGTNPEEVKATLNPSQSQTGSTANIAPYDFKISNLISASSPHRFRFNSLMTMLKFSFSIGSSLVGDKLESITMQVANRKLAGPFTIDITNPSALGVFGEDAVDVVTLTFSEKPTLTTENPVIGWMFINPDVKQNDPIVITITTDNHVIVANKSAGKNFSAGYRYTMDVPDISEGTIIYEKADYNFLQQNHYGSYDLASSAVAPSFTYTPFESQWGFSTSSDDKQFRIQNYKSNSAILWSWTASTPMSLSNSYSFDITEYSSDGNESTSKSSATCEKISEGKAWLINHETHKGYIIKNN